ncbi:hypothetical protein [Providencia alcalifaciens]|nr:hypothetical protein [Providencia alcalifaciens]
MIALRTVSHAVELTFQIVKELGVYFMLLAFDVVNNTKGINYGQY